MASSNTVNTGEMNAVPSTPSPINVKVHFYKDVFVIQVPRATEYSELEQTIRRNIRLHEVRGGGGPLRLKFRDEDGDMIVLGSTEDVRIVFEEQDVPGGEVELFARF